MELANTGKDRSKGRAEINPCEASSSSSAFITRTKERRESGRRPRKMVFAFSIIAITVSMVLIIAATGAADYSTSTTNGSILGNKVISDTSFTISNDGVRIATQSDVGTTAFPGPPLEMTDPHVILRTNTIAEGNFAYKVTLTEATALTSGTWNIYVYKDGVQVGQMVKVKQASAVSGTTEGAVLIADLGSSYPSSNTVFEVKIVKN